MLALTLAYALMVALLAVGWLLDHRQLTTELRTTQDRLYGAWQAGAQIPPRLEEAVEIPPLPPELQALVSEWSSPDVRSALEDRIRRMLARQMTPSDIAKTLTIEAASRAF